MGITLEKVTEEQLELMQNDPKRFWQNVTEIGKWAFKDCKSLENIHIPEGVTRIGEGAFRGCTSLKSIHIPESVTEIGKWAFKDCESLKEITIPESVKTIGKRALGFVDCKVNIIIDHFMVYTISSFRLEKFSLDEIREQCRKSGAGRVDVNLAVKYDAAQKALARSAQATNKKVKLTTRKSEVGGKD